MMNHLDISDTRTHLKAAGIVFNKDDSIVVDGDLSELSGYIEVFKGVNTIRFTIMRRNNGIFVDYNDGYGRNYIKKVA
jgi:hypothetical protein